MFSEVPRLVYERLCLYVPKITRTISLPVKNRATKKEKRISRIKPKEALNFESPDSLSSFPPRQRRVRSVLSPRCVRAAARRAVLSPSLYLSGSVPYRVLSSTRFSPFGSRRVSLWVR
jgi:hypothetical protein